MRTKRMTPTGHDKVVIGQDSHSITRQEFLKGKWDINDVRIPLGLMNHRRQSFEFGNGVAKELSEKTMLAAAECAFMRKHNLLADNKIWRREPLEEPFYNEVKDILKFQLRRIHLEHYAYATPSEIQNTMLAIANLDPVRNFIRAIHEKTVLRHPNDTEKNFESYFKSAVISNVESLNRVFSAMGFYLYLHQNAYDPERYTVCLFKIPRFYKTSGGYGIYLEKGSESFLHNHFAVNEKEGYFHGYTSSIMVFEDQNSYTAGSSNPIISKLIHEIEHLITAAFSLATGRAVSPWRIEYLALLAQLSHLPGCDSEILFNQFKRETAEFPANQMSNEMIFLFPHLQAEHQLMTDLANAGANRGSAGKNSRELINSFYQGYFGITLDRLEATAENYFAER